MNGVRHDILRCYQVNPADIAGTLLFKAGQ